MHRLFSDYKNTSETFDIDPSSGRFAVKKKLDRENESNKPGPFEIWVRIYLLYTIFKTWLTTTAIVNGANTTSHSYFSM